MILRANNIVEPNIKKLLRHYSGNLIYGVFLLFFILFLLIAYPKNNFLFLLAGCVISFIIIIVMPYLKAVRKLNRIIEKIEINQLNVIFTTVELIVIGGFLKLKSKKFHLKINELIITRDDNDIFRKNFRSEIYSFSFHSKKFYIVKDFFDDFKSIATNLHFDN
jgi:hypothetical protein